MIPLALSICFVSGLIIGQNEATRMPESLAYCGPELFKKCSDEYRLCDILEDGKEKCGQCQLGYIDFSDGENNLRDGGNNITQIWHSCVDIAEITWQRFVTAYDPYYSNMEDSVQRLTVLKESAQLVSQSNTLNRNATYTLGLTPFSVDAQVEYQQRSGYFYVNVSGTSDELTAFNPPTVAAADISMNIDWVAAGAVRSVKNQGRCGCSWAIAVCGAIEGAAYLIDGSKESMSFQQLISCNKRNLGCNGGSMTVGAKYTADYWFGGVTTLNDYPYTDFDGLTSNVCSLTPETPSPAVEVNDPIAVAGFDTMMSFDKRLETFKLALMEKPVSIILKSSCKVLSNYISGILTDDGDCACSESTCYDHAVLMVGYNDTDTIPYFKLKNSWGTRWGEGGYFRVAQKEKGAYGLFGILGEGVMIEVQRIVDVNTVEVVEGTYFPIWAIVFIAMLSLLCCCCCTYIGCVHWARNRKEC